MVAWGLETWVFQLFPVSGPAAERPLRWAAGVGVNYVCIALVVLALLPSRAATEPTQKIQGGYSVQPLSRAVFDPARVTVEAVGYNEWLINNQSSLGTPESMKGPREHLYYLIDSWVKTIYARDGVVLPVHHDALLQTFFSWAERLGTFGGHLVYNAVKSDQFPEMSPLLEAPSGFDVALRQDMLKVSSSRGHWSVEVPYYFMIWNIIEWDAKDGPRTQLVAVSTGAATHEGQDGHSQATLMLLFGPGSDGDSFTEYWARHLGFNGKEEARSLNVRSLQTRHRLDKSQNMHSEYTSWTSPHGHFVVAYLGINGAYQWNRPHFIDFVRSIVTE